MIRLGILRNNVSRNSTGGNFTIGNGNTVTLDTGNARSRQSGLGAAAGNGNTIQVNILSYNIYNPQYSIGGDNVRNNTTVSNVAMANGNDSRSGKKKHKKQARSTGYLGMGFLGLLTGNGNTVQFAFLSGNIVNPQLSLGGTNVSNNTAVTNVAADNGNGSEHVSPAGFWWTGLPGGMQGNGNTVQVAAGTTNIVNPQVSLGGGGNVSNNSATTNAAIGNGNFSSTEATSTGGLGNTSVFGRTGNGNTTQSAIGSGNINNDQFNFGISGVRPVSSGGDLQRQSPGLDTADSDSSFSSRITASVNRTLGFDPSRTSTLDDSGGNGIPRPRVDDTRRGATDGPSGGDNDPSGSGDNGTSGDGGGHVKALRRCG